MKIMLLVTTLIEQKLCKLDERWCEENVKNNDFLIKYNEP